MSIELEGLQIGVAHGSDDTLAELVDAVSRRHSVAFQAGTVASLMQSAKSDRPQLLVAGVTFPDGDGIDTAIELGKTDPMPSVIVTARRSLELVEKAMRDHVMAYLIEPVDPLELEAAVTVAWSRFQQLTELAGEVDDLKAALESRKLVERAKGVLMAREEISEGEAFARLRGTAQDTRRRMVDVANDILKEESDASAG